MQNISFISTLFFNKRRFQFVDSTESNLHFTTRVIISSAPGTGADLWAGVDLVQWMLNESTVLAPRKPEGPKHYLDSQSPLEFYVPNEWISLKVHPKYLMSL
jgi:hypothetical protein